jgi:uncharacterized RDD family membrane protein YckC
VRRRPHKGIIARMTQQDETGQGAATQQPAAPSPYLYGGESVPEAYLAPPQPGKPSYGTPPAYRPGLRQGGSRQPSFGRPASVQPRSRPGRPEQAQRDPAIAAPWQRLVASALDWLIIFVVSVLALWSPLARLFHEVQAISASHPDTSSPAAQAAFDSVFRDPSNQHTVLYWFLAMFGIALAYYWVQHAAWGATIGKRALGVQVVQAGDRSSIGVRTAGIRAAAFLIGPAAFFIGPAAFLLVGGLFEVAGGALWIADTGLSLLDPRTQCLHDKLAGTIVIRQRWLAQQARSDRPW